MTLVDRQQYSKSECLVDTNNNEVASKTIMDLNNDCLSLIIGFLSSNDLLTLGLIDDRFAGLVASRLAKQLFNLYEFQGKFKEKEAEVVLIKFGSYIKKVILTSQLFSMYNDFSKPYIKLLIEYCRNIQEIRIDHINFRYISQDIFKYCKNSLRSLDTSHFLSNDKDAYIVGQLTKLQRLNLCLSDISGEHLTSLTNLIHLELSGCSQLNPRHLETICKNNQLKLLDIRFCTLLDTCSFRTIVDCQGKSLEELAISSAYPSADVAILTEITSLKRIRVSFYGCLRNDCILSQLADRRKDTLECLKIDRTYYCAHNAHEELACILRLPNLRKLELCGFAVGKEYVLRLLYSCPKLKYLRLLPAVRKDVVMEARKRFEKLRFYS